MRPLRTKALWLAVLVALGAILVVAPTAGALPRNLSHYFFGAKLARMNVVVRDAGADRLFRLDRGRVRAVRPAAGTVTLLERDGTLAVIQVAPDAEVTVRGRSVPLNALRRGMVVTTVRDGDAPAHLVQAGRVARALSQYLFGPRLVRMEVVVRDAGGTLLYRVDRGRIRAVRPAAGTISVLERDGTLAVVPVAPDALVTVNGRSVPLGALRRGMLVTTVREGDLPAELVIGRR